MFFNNSMTLLQTAFNESPYFEYLFRNAKEIGFRFPTECVLATLNYEEGVMDFKSCNDDEIVEPELWVEMDDKELEQLVKNKKPVKHMRITTSNRGQVLHPSVERILQRIFMPPKDGTYPLNDRIELIYGGLFGFKEPRVIWRSRKSDLLVLKYASAYNGLDVYITTGFTTPGIGESVIDVSHASGFGYELILFSQPDSDILGRQLAGWASYVDETNNHIIQGQYLEYPQKYIPKTDISGFLVLAPIEFPDRFPVADGYGTFNLLLGVTPKELKVAKKQDNYIVADKLFKAGYINYSPIKRKSVR